MLGNGAATNLKIADGAVNSNKVQNGSLLGTDVADGNLDGADIEDDSLTGADISSDEFTNVTGPAGLGEPDACPGGALGTFCGGATLEQLGYWANYGNGYAPVRFFKDAAGVVHLEGLVEAGGIPAELPETIFVLPHAYRPEGGRLVFSVDCADRENEEAPPSDAHGRVDVLPDGRVVWPGVAQDWCRPVEGYLSLSGIAFRGP